MTSLMTCKAAVFDAYGTVFDVHAAVRGMADRVGPQAQAISDLWRVKQLEYTWTRSLIGRYRDFWAVTSEALTFTLARHGIADAGLHASLMNAYRTLDAYPDARDVLAHLHAGGIKTAILSNGSPDMLASAVDNADLAAQFDAVISVHSLGIFKPPARAYSTVTTTLGVAPQEIVFVSSNRWDIAGAAAVGFQPVWCNRTAQPDEYADLAPRATIRSLTELPALLAR